LETSFHSEVYAGRKEDEGRNSEGEERDREESANLIETSPHANCRLTRVGCASSEELGDSSEEEEVQVSERRSTGV